MTSDQAPPPLVPRDCDLSGFPFMPLEVKRLTGSDLARSGKPAECWAAVLLWCESWQQVPAASLPDDNVVLASLTGYGRDVKSWLKVREGALRGWIKADDGRLYHPVVAEKALEAWLEKLAQRISGGEGNAKRWGMAFDRVPLVAAMDTARAMLSALNPESRTLRKKRTAGLGSGSQPDRDPIPSGSRQDRNRQGQGQGQRQGQRLLSESESDEHDIATPSPEPQPPAADADRWGYVRTEAWVRNLVAAGCKIGAGSWPAWKTLCDRWPLLRVIEIAATVPATERFHGQVEEALKAAGTASSAAAIAKKTRILDLSA